MPQVSPMYWTILSISLISLLLISQVKVYFL